MVTDFLFKNLYTKQIIIKNTFWLVVAEGICKILKLFLVICIARILGATDYGEFSFALSFVSVFVIFSDFGVSAITTREFAKDKENENDYPAIFSLKIILGFIALFLMIIGSFFITVDPAIKKIIWILSAYITATNFTEILYAFFRARQKMEYEAMAKILQSVLITAIGIFVIFNLPSVDNLGFSYLFGSLIAIICTLLFFHFKVSPIKFSIRLSVWKNFLQNSWPLGTSTILAAIPVYAGPLIMGNLGLIPEIGWYAAAGKITSFLFIPSIIISQSFYPILCKNFQRSKENFKRACWQQIKYKLLVLSPLVIGILIFAPKIIKLIYGSGFEPSVRVLQILIISMIMQYMISSLHQILIIGNQQKKIIFFALFSAIVGTVINLALIPKFGLYGTTLSYLLISVFNFLFLLILVSIFASAKPFNFASFHTKNTKIK